MCVVPALFALLVQGQSSVSRYETDINGHRVETAKTSSVDGNRTETSQSINGRQVPLERTEEKLLSESPHSRVTERIVRKFDPTGVQNGIEKILIEEEILTGGSKNVKETTWRSDLNGSLIQAERRNVEVRVSGASTTTETVISRPDINGSISLAERRSQVAEKSGDQIQTSEVVQRRNTNGQFYDALREVKVFSSRGEQSTENVTSYEPDANGRLDVARQTVTIATKRSDGSEVKEVNLYGKGAEGHAQERGVSTQIREQQIVERKKLSDGSVVESVSVRRPTVSDPSRLGNSQKLHETVCRGKCN